VARPRRGAIERIWSRQGRAALPAARRQGQRPDRPPTLSYGPLNELLTLHEQLGTLPSVAGLAAQRQGAGLPDPFLPRSQPFPS
jgi:hypothetical protein